MSASTLTTMLERHGITVVDGDVFQRDSRIGSVTRGINGRWFPLSLSEEGLGDPLQGNDNLSRTGSATPEEAAGSRWLPRRFMIETVVTGEGRYTITGTIPSEPAINPERAIAEGWDHASALRAAITTRATRHRISTGDVKAQIVEEVARW